MSGLKKTSKFSGLISYTILFSLSATTGILTSACGSHSQRNSNADENAYELNSSQPTSVRSGAVEQKEILEVAVIGDSQSTGGYGRRLSELIRQSSKQRLVYFGAASSARMGSWVNGGFAPIPSNAYFGCESETDARSCAPSMQSGRRTESINAILRRNSFADLYILTLGDNHFYDSASVRNELPQLVKPILSTGAKCAFVTPTKGTGRFADKRTLISNIKSALDAVKNQIGSTCTLIDSYTVGQDVLKSNADLLLMRDSVSADPMGLHPQGTGARLWAERVFQALLDRKMLNSL